MVDNIYNSQGRLVNQKEILEVYQFREMFVQEYNPDIVYKDKCIMMGLPLMENCVNDFEGEDKYWMNSPLAEEEK